MKPQLWLSFILLLLPLTFPVHVHSNAAGLDWDPRLDALGVTRTPAENCTPGCWQLTSARYEDPGESGGTHHIYARLLLESGDAPAGLPWHVRFPDGDIRVLSKAAPEWADVPLFACYDPSTQTGAYRAYAGEQETQSDVVHGMGLPQCQHVNFRLIWQWREQNLLYLPLVWNNR